jgi:uncharacterized protein (DUF2336 family)
MDAGQQKEFLEAIAAGVIMWLDVNRAAVLDAIARRTSAGPTVAQVMAAGYPRHEPEREGGGS